MSLRVFIQLMFSRRLTVQHETLWNIHKNDTGCHISIHLHHNCCCKKWFTFRPHYYVLSQDRIVLANSYCQGNASGSIFCSKSRLMENNQPKEWSGVHPSLARCRNPIQLEHHTLYAIEFQSRWANAFLFHRCLYHIFSWKEYDGREAWILTRT